MLHQLSEKAPALFDQHLPTVKVSESLNKPSSHMPLHPRSRPPCKRRRSYSPALDSPLMIVPTNPSLPTILVTPADDSPRETSAWVPYQDAAFGGRLTVPSHPTYNAVHGHPPCLGKDDRLVLPKVNQWRYNEGHWEIILPSVQEQVKMGAFSRAVVVKRRHCNTAR